MGDKEDRDFLLGKETGGRFQEETPLNARATVTFPACDLGVVNNGTGIQWSAPIVLVAPFKTLGKLLNLLHQDFLNCKNQKSSY